jgi:hypothetical protein
MDLHFYGLVASFALADVLILIWMLLTQCFRPGQMSLPVSRVTILPGRPFHRDPVLSACTTPAMFRIFVPV